MIVGEGPGSCFTFLVCIVCKYRQRLDTVSLLWIRRVTKLAFGSHGNWEVLFPLGVLQIMKKNGPRALSQIIIPRRKETRNQYIVFYRLHIHKFHCSIFKIIFRIFKLK